MDEGITLKITLKQVLLVSILGVFLLAPVISQQDTPGLREEDGLNHVWLKYRLGPGVRRNTLVEDTGYSLTYNARPLMKPLVVNEGGHRVDLMIVNKPPFVDDEKGWFNLSEPSAEVAWAALTLNLSYNNATIIFERTLDFTNTSVFNITRDVNLSYNWVEIDTATLKPLNRHAKIILSNLTFNAVKIEKNYAHCTDCTVLSYQGGRAVFKVVPTLLNYRAVELAGWINWDLIDLTSAWIGSTDNNLGVILVGEEGEDGTLRQYYSSNDTTYGYYPKLEVNYTLRDQTFYNNETLTDVWDLDNYFHDPEGMTLSYTQSSDHPNIQVTIGGDNTVDIQAIDNFAGTQYVVFTADDGLSGVATSNNVTLTVLNGITTTTTTLANYDPIVFEVKGPDPVALFVGTVKNVSYNASIFDEDGCAEIEAAQGIFWDTTTAVHSDTADDNELYKNTSCDISCTGDDGIVKCGFNLKYYAQPSAVWAINISVRDDDNKWAHNTTTDVEVQDLVGVNAVEGSIDFSATEGGSIDLGQSSSDDTVLTVQNYGNVILDMLASGSDLACGVGSIGVNNVKYDSQSGQAIGSMCQLTDDTADTCPALEASYDLAKTISDTPQEDLIYWKIQIPASGVGGSCSGTVTITGEKS
ncbi:MAG: hypothetical protein GF416_09035 [Candidatus Altiarchaeales archaeon]|nr:hypothetical protein [Candidatus Altiarchaeales archaeon]MBD3417262.1 hypothetical protein [Candidatus Altiarchaeales archaeon]